MRPAPANTATGAAPRQARQAPSPPAPGAGGRWQASVEGLGILLDVGAAPKFLDVGDHVARARAARGLHHALRPDLPAEIVQLEIKKVNPGLVNIVQMALVSEDAPYAELETLARELKDILKALPGIRTAESWAYPDRELRVALDLKRVAELGLTPGQVVQADQVVSSISENQKPRCLKKALK